MSFRGLEANPSNHHQLRSFAAIAGLVDRLTALSSREAALQAFPFLCPYVEEIEAAGMAGANVDAKAWHRAIRKWEARAKVHLPLASLRAMKLDEDAIDLLMTIGLPDVDARFGLVFESVQIGSPRRPTWGLLETWQRAAGTEARGALKRLLDLGLVRVTQADSPRLEWPLEIAPAVADALRGEPHPRLRPADSLRGAADLVLPDDASRFVDMCVSAMGSGEASSIVVRGPGGSGRHALVGAIARALGQGVLVIEGKPERDAWAGALLLGRLLHAMPVLRVDLAAGDAWDMPTFDHSVPTAVVTSRHGSVRGDRTLRFDLPIFSEPLRRRIWARLLPQAPEASHAQWASTFRVGAARMAGVARTANLTATTRGAAAPDSRDLRLALRAEGARALETLATRVEMPGGDWKRLAAPAETMAELRTLEARCRHRERLAEMGTGGAPHTGVRALFKGPSGTGKTLAATLLGAVLDKDVHRVDLAGIVSKYIGETEKNLSQLFACAEELDVILLFDEGDALFARRTNVQSSNDRYANLETNYLLQRIESFDGIAVIATNSGEAIDSAFTRRMDVIVDFRSPEAPERWRIWQSHLPAGHATSNETLREISGRCAMTGGQIKNAVLHATLLALDEGCVVRDDHVEAAVQREYRKSGANCPLRRPLAARHDVS
jgi:hypothetical protein